MTSEGVTSDVTTITNQDRTRRAVVYLCAGTSSTWRTRAEKIPEEPGWVGGRVMWGHDQETRDAAISVAEDWTERGIFHEKPYSPFGRDPRTLRVTSSDADVLKGPPRVEYHFLVGPQNEDLGRWNDLADAKQYAHIHASEHYSYSGLTTWNQVGSLLVADLPHPDFSYKISTREA